MKPKTEITIPDEILKEIEAYSKAENITLNEFVIWALGEKVGELFGRRCDSVFFLIFEKF